MTIKADDNRYERMTYRTCGRSGLKLPVLSLGGWHNFTDREHAEAMIRCAFDHGVTHIDLANNYGPPPGAAEEVVGDLLDDEFKAYRDEMIISSKAGYTMWPGPYGDWGSRKYLLASLDQSLRRLKLDYVDIFYSHRFDPNTPLDETMGALDTAVKQGKALYAGVSNYSGEQTRRAAEVLRELGTPLTIHQPRYSMLVRDIENDLLPVTDELGIGVINYSPLAQGLLSEKYLDGIPEQSRVADPHGFLRREQVTDDVISKVRRLKDLANERGQNVSQLALSWCLCDARVTSVLFGARNMEQVEENLAVTQAAPLDDATVERIEEVLS